jgi:hypothetical protein
MNFGLNWVTYVIIYTMSSTMVRYNLHQLGVTGKEL